MSAICIRANDNFSIITTAINKRPWGDCKVQVQVKTQEGDLELTVNNMIHLNILLDAFNQLSNDINDEQLEVDQIRSRVFNSNNVTPIIRRPFSPFSKSPSERHLNANSHPHQQET